MACTGILKLHVCTQYCGSHPIAFSLCSTGVPDRSLYLSIPLAPLHLLPHPLPCVVTKCFSALSTSALPQNVWGGCRQVALQSLLGCSLLWSNAPPHPLSSSLSLMSSLSLLFLSCLPCFSPTSWTTVSHLVEYRASTKCEYTYKYGEQYRHTDQASTTSARSVSSAELGFGGWPFRILPPSCSRSSSIIM